MHVIGHIQGSKQIGQLSDHEKSQGVQWMSVQFLGQKYERVWLAGDHRGAFGSFRDRYFSQELKETKTGEWILDLLCQVAKNTLPNVTVSLELLEL